MSEAILVLNAGSSSIKYSVFVDNAAGPELLLRGQTPGKRALGIRDVRDGGLPLGARQVLIRNLLRVVDTLPPPLCIVGAISILATRTGQRLGDIAAGTLVVRERFRRAREAAATSAHAAGWEEIQSCRLM